jgi:hypothetical protein
MAEVRDRFLLTKRKYEDLITQGLSSASTWAHYPAESGPYEFAEVSAPHASVTHVTQHVALFTSTSEYSRSHMFTLFLLIFCILLGRVTAIISLL